jgi:hypothetical protein
MYRFGPRYIFHRTNRVSAFGQMLAGGSRLTLRSGLTQGNSKVTSSTDTDGFAFAADVGVDVAWKRWFAFRAFQIDCNHIDQTGLRNGLRIAGASSFVSVNHGLARACTRDHFPDTAKGVTIRQDGFPPRYACRQSWTFPDFSSRIRPISSVLKHCSFCSRLTRCGRHPKPRRE